MKKIASLLIVFVLVLAMVPAMAEGEINMFIASPEYADAVNELIAAYKEVAPDVTINYETTQNDYPTLLKTRINAGTTPDIFSTNRNTIINSGIARKQHRKHNQCYHKNCC